MNNRRQLNVLALEDEAMLLGRISSGDQSAFNEVFGRYRKLVYNYALYFIKSTEEAEEITLDVFMKIWLHKNPVEIENLQYYLKTLTKNRTFSVLRHKKLECTLPAELDENTAGTHNQTEESILLKDTSKIITQGISLLPPQQKKIYTLCRIEGLKYSQAAERLAISPLTVKSHMQQATRFLRKYMEINQVLSLMLISMELIKEKK